MGVYSTNVLARGMTTDGQAFTVNHIQMDSPLGGPENRITESVSVDVGGQVFGFLNAGDAFRFIESGDAEEYDAIDQFGGKLTMSRVGLAVPSGMYRKTREGDRLHQVSVPTTIIPPNATQYPQTAAALNAPPDAADFSHGSMTGENQQMGHTVGTRQGAAGVAVAVDGGAVQTAPYTPTAVENQNTGTPAGVDSTGGRNDTRVNTNTGDEVGSQANANPARATDEKPSGSDPKKDGSKTGNSR